MFCCLCASFSFSTADSIADFIGRNFVAILFSCFPFGIPNHRQHSTCQFFLSALSLASLAFAFGFHFFHFIFRQTATCFNVYFCSLPVPLSLAERAWCHFASISKSYFNLGEHRVVPAEYHPDWKYPGSYCLRHRAFSLQYVNLHWLIIALSGRKPLISLLGIVVLDWIKVVITPPNVSIPNESGVTSSNNTSFYLAG